MGTIEKPEEFEFQQAEQEAKALEREVNKYQLIWRKPITQRGWKFLKKETVFSEDVSADFWLYFRNHSVFISACAQSYDNPYKRIDKLMFFLSELTFIFFLSILVEGVIFQNGTLGQEILAGVIIGFFGEIYARLLEFIGFCKCVLKRETLPGCVICCTQCCGSLVLLMSFFLTIILALFSLLLLSFSEEAAKEEGDEEGDVLNASLTQFGISFVAGRVGEILVLFIRFYLRRKREQGEEISTHKFLFKQAAGGAVVVKVADFVVGVV